MSEYSKDDIIDFLNERVFFLQKELEQRDTIILQMEEELKLHNHINELEKKTNELEKEADNLPPNSMYC